jgi:hypothetical protein
VGEGGEIRRHQGDRLTGKITLAVFATGAAAAGKAHATWAKSFTRDAQAQPLAQTILSTLELTGERLNQWTVDKD